MAGLNKPSLTCRIRSIRKMAKEKNVTAIFRSPLNVLLLALFVMRASILRLMPRMSRMYFIRKEFSELTEKIIMPGYNYKKYSQNGEELEEFVRIRSREDKDCFYDDYSSEIATRLRSGVTAHALLENGKIVTIFFATKEKCNIGQVNYTYTPEHGEIAITDIYTLAPFRKRGLYSQLLHHAAGCFSASGDRTFVMWIMKHNRATIRAQIKNGFSEVFQTVIWFSWLGIEKVVVRRKVQPLDRL